jgi:hypothetical protein
MSSKVSPNLVDPEENTILADTNSVWNSWAVSIPVTITSPSTSNLAPGLVVPIPTLPPSATTRCDCPVLFAVKITLSPVVFMKPPLVLLLFLIWI